MQKNIRFLNNENFYSIGKMWFQEIILFTSGAIYLKNCPFKYRNEFVCQCCNRPSDVFKYTLKINFRGH